MRRAGQVWAALSALWAGLILYSSTTHAERLTNLALDRIFALFSDAAQGSGPAPEYFWEKKALHVLLFLTLAFLLSRTARSAACLTPGIIMLAGAGVGVLSELFQWFFPGREPSLADALLNAAATCAGVLAFHPWGRRQTRPATTLS